MTFKNVKKNIFLTIPLGILLIAAFTVFACLFSVSKYSYNDTFTNTLEYNDIYVVPVTEYLETAFFYHGEMIFYGSQVYYENVSTDDISRLQEKTSGQIPIYQSYFFNKSFQDFTDFHFAYDPDRNLNCYIALNFTEVIIVDDFSTFYQPKLYGEYPTGGNQVAIYDYMADMMIYVGAFPEKDSMEELLNETLVDKDTGQEMTITCILKSDYTKYEYTKDKNSGHYSFESKYLAMLQSIYATPDFMPQIMSNTDTYSINNIIFSDETYVNTFANDNQYRKITTTDDLSGFDMIATQDGIENGLLFSNYQIADILGIDVEDVDADFFDNYGSVYSTVYEYFYTWSYNKTDLLGYVCMIYGIYESDSLNDETLYCFTSYDNYFGYKSGTLRKSYLSLCEDWDVNREILSTFHMPQKPESFFIENPDYYYSDFTEYTPFSIVIDEAAQYMESVGKTGEYLGIVAAIVMFVGVCGYGYLSINRNRYRIGVIKSLGASNVNLVSVFCLETIAVVIMAFAISIIPSQIILGAINQEFYSYLTFDVIFFTLGGWDYLLLFGGILLATALSLLIPMMVLLKKEPYRIIRKGLDE